MSNEYICVICGATIPAETIARRHYSPEKPMPPIDKMVCSRACSDELRRRTGLYARMSQAGSAARSRAVARSNREQPRRRSKSAAGPG